MPHQRQQRLTARHLCSSSPPFSMHVNNLDFRRTRCPLFLPFHLPPSFQAPRHAMPCGGKACTCAPMPVSSLLLLGAYKSEHQEPLSLLFLFPQPTLSLSLSRIHFSRSSRHHRFRRHGSSSTLTVDFTQSWATPCTHSLHQTITRTSSPPSTGRLHRLLRHHRRTPLVVSSKPCALGPPRRTRPFGTPPP